MSSEVLAPPAISGQVVLVRTGDARLYALDAADGGQLWMHEQDMPSLVLRGSSGIALADTLAVAGFDNGKVVALQVRDGQLAWETAVATPEGRTEIERMVDVATPRVIGRDVYAVTFQGRLAAMALESGRVLWSHEMSSGAGLDADGRGVFVTDADSVVHAYDRVSGTKLWQQDGMRLRTLTAPTVVGNDAVAVGDFEGWVHLLARDSGELVARVRVGSGPIHSAPAAFAGWLLVQSAGGELAAFRVGAEQE